MTGEKRPSNPRPSDDLAATLSAALVRGALPGERQGFGPRERQAAVDLLLKALAKRRHGYPAIVIETFADREGQRRMRVAVVNDDMPFLVDSTAAVIAAHGLVITRLLHPVMKVERDEEGRLTDLGHGADAESIIYIEAERADARTRQLIQQGLRDALSQVKHAVADWPVMQKRAREDAEGLGDTGEAAFLNWMADGRFTMLGHVEFDAKGADSGGKGIARKALAELIAPDTRRNAMAWFRETGAPVLIMKSNRLSAVHRRVPLDLVIVPRRSKARITGLSVHAGLWTSAALADAAGEVPILRARLAALQKGFKFAPASHAGKALEHALATLPHDIGVSISEDDLARLAATAMSIADRPRAAIECVTDPLGRHLFAFVWLPRDEVSTVRRQAITEMLLATSGGRLLSWSSAFAEADTATLRFVIDLRGDGQKAGAVPDPRVLQQHIESMVRGWPRALETQLARLVDKGQAARLAIRYAPTLPTPYRERTDPADAAQDVIRLHALPDALARRARLVPGAPDRPSHVRLHILALAPVILSDVVPALENFGFSVIEEVPTRLIAGSDGRISDLLLETGSAAVAASLIADPTPIEDAIRRVIEGEAADDRFNALMVSTGIEAESAVLLRALFRYLRQTGMSYGLLTVVEALRRSPDVTRALIDLFAARHDPDGRKNEARADAARSAITEGLAAISAADDDHILRLYRAVIEAILRTNFFAPAAREALAFKIDSARVPGLPSPVPWREIFVYSPRVEGIHLRAGPVARGGLRWSDRRDDFRTEILGLMKAQRVKNAVIVPTGAKGGFYPKQLPDAGLDRAAWLAEGTESYRVFIRTLLSVTDNLVGGKVVHPSGVVCHDGDDPYFVVAADKGTATFSDVANAIALERGFWLGDAFASGGSVGYDHKAMGITARGGWVSVQRHFSELGTDVQTEPVRVAGCGDMSGDVFGNGMLLSKSIKLVAAFDHRHIFIDPDPDPANSWAERNRLFALPRSSWADYDAKLISAGGGIFPRSAKTIPLNDTVRALLDIQATELEPAALISAILKSPVDLIWFGGIGTYIKARSENNAEVGDRANDGLRVNADEVRARVIGEGANLGVTQAGRIAFSLKGGRINTDFIDNSAGVDCSDNEVNIKIALNGEVLAGSLALKARNALLARMTDDVSALVLEDNRLQTLALSIAERDGARDLPSHIRLIENFELAGQLDRAVEGIAPNDELMRRVSEGKGLTRPELAVLLSTAKLALQAGIEASALGTDPATEGTLMAAFPMAMQRKHRDAILGHQLRREIIATKIANRIVNRMGLTYPFELAEEEGATLGSVAEAFVIVEQLFDLPALWADIDTAAVPEATRLMMFEQVAVEMRAHMADVLRNAIEERRNDQAVAAYAPSIRKLSAARESLMKAEARRQTRAFSDRLLAQGAPAELVARIVRLAELDGAIGLSALAARSGTDIVALTRAFTELGEALGIDWAQGAAMQMDPEDPWERLLVAGLARDFQAMRLDFLARQGAKSGDDAVADWLKRNASAAKTYRATMDRARKVGIPTPAMLAQIAGQGRTLLGR